MKRIWLAFAPFMAMVLGFSQLAHMYLKVCVPALAPTHYTNAMQVLNFVPVNGMFETVRLFSEVDNAEVMSNTTVRVLWQEGLPYDYFNNLLSCTLTMFQIYTLESWTNGIVRPAAHYAPLTVWMIFLPFVVLVVMIVINYFTGIVVDAVRSHSAVLGVSVWYFSARWLQVVSNSIAQRDEDEKVTQSARLHGACALASLCVVCTCRSINCREESNRLIPCSGSLSFVTS